MKRFDGKTTVMALVDKCVQLLPMHAITGCDTVSYPFGKGKMSSLKVIMDSDHLEIELFGESNATISDVMCTGCRIVGRLYGATCDTTMNALRYKILSTRLRWPAARDMGQTRGLRFSHVLIDRHLIHHHTKAFFQTKPLNAYIRQLTTCPSCF